MHRYRHPRMGRHIGTGLAAAALTTTAWLPGAAAASTGWQVAFRAHSGASTIFNGLIAPDDILVHYNGTTWQQVTSAALAGLQFGSIRALSDSNVWVTATVGGGSPQHLLHFDGHSWTSLPVPSGVQLRAIAPDGHGGTWFSADRTTSQTPIAEHRSATGTWSSHPLPTGAGQAFGIAPIPGTTSLWASGYLEASGATGSDAVVWGYGPAA